jgi:hypothetical protein
MNYGRNRGDGSESGDCDCYRTRQNKARPQSGLGNIGVWHFLTSFEEMT